MKHKGMNKLNNLQEFLADTEGQTKKEVAEELRREGVDVEKFNSDVRSIIDTACRAYPGRAAEGTHTELHTKSREEILQLLGQIQAGVFGNDLAEMLAARQQNDKGLAEEDIQILLRAAESRLES